MSDDELTLNEILFEDKTPLGFSVRTTVNYWNLTITTKHPAISDKLQDVRLTLTEPDEVHISKKDEQVYMFYRSDGDKRWVCAVTKRLDTIGFLITAYRTSAIKEGSLLWKK